MGHVNPDVLDIELLAFYTQEGQNPTMVRKLYQKFIDYVSPNEHIQGIFIQAKPFLPGAVIMTPGRFIMYRPHMTGSSDTETFWWEMYNIRPRIEEGMFFSTFLVDLHPKCGTGPPPTVGMDYLPKAQALKLLSYAREQFRFWDDENRVRMLQDLRAQAGGLQLQGDVAGLSHAEKVVVPVPASIRKPPTLIQPAPEPHKAPEILPEALLKEKEEKKAPAEPAPNPLPVQTVKQEFDLIPIGKKKIPILPIPKQVAEPAVPIAPTPPPTQAADQQSPSSTINALKQLKELFDEGLIEREEYMKKRSEILARI